MTYRPFLPRAAWKGASRLVCIAAAVAAVLILATTGLHGQGVATDDVFRGFEPSGELQLEVEGETVPGAEIYRSRRAAALLILTSRFPSPVLIMPRSASVQTVHIMKLSKNADGTIDLLADATLDPQGKFQVDGTEVVFQVEGREARLKEKPPLLKLQEAEDLEAYDPSYGRRARSYEPDPTALAALRRNGQPVRVRVYFGTWCPFCKQYLPYLLRVEDELDDSNIRFEYYGLPRPFSGEPAASRDQVSGVPTGIVYVDGKEVGRILGDGWRSPEVTLRRLLSGS